MRKFRLVFTDIHRHMDLVGEATEQTLVSIIQLFISDGKLMLSELIEVEE